MFWGLKEPKGKGRRESSNNSPQNTMAQKGGGAHPNAAKYRNKGRPQRNQVVNIIVHNEADIQKAAIAVRVAATKVLRDPEAKLEISVNGVKQEDPNDLLS